jgi:phosphonate C-P lyase system protein PhnG
MLDNMDTEINATKTDIGTRPAWLGVLARSDHSSIRSHLSGVPTLPDFAHLRRPETGMAMVRGRIGGSGAAFNLGEITIARCSICDTTGRVGHGYAVGRDLAQVELIARLDAALQNPDLHACLIADVINPLAGLIAARRSSTEAQAQATEVEFFTLATMRS